MTDFFNMGGYAFFVWTSYGLAFVIFVANIIAPIQRKAAIIRQLKRRQRRGETT